MDEYSELTSGTNGYRIGVNALGGGKTGEYGQDDSKG